MLPSFPTEIHIFSYGTYYRTLLYIATYFLPSPLSNIFCLFPRSRRWSLLHDPKRMLCPIDIRAAIRNKRFFLLSPDSLFHCLTGFHFLHFPLPQQTSTAGDSLRMVQAFLLEEFVRSLLCPLLCSYTFWCFFCFLLPRSFFFSFTSSGTSISPNR